MTPFIASGRPAHWSKSVRRLIICPPIICILILLGCTDSGLGNATGTSQRTPTAVVDTTEPAPFIEDELVAATSTTLAPRAALVTLVERTQGELCALMTSSETTLVLGPALPAVFLQVPTVGTGCRWTTRDRTTSVQFLVMATTTFEQLAQAAAAAERQGIGVPGRETVIAGRPAIVHNPVFGDPLNGEARIEVALGEASDPVAEFRGPTVALATSVAELIAPRLIMLASTPLPIGAGAS